jgi:hypothetical protein
MFPVVSLQTVDTSSDLIIAGFWDAGEGYSGSWEILEATGTGT